MFGSKQLTLVKESNYPAKFKSLSLRQNGHQFLVSVFICAIWRRFYQIIYYLLSKHLVQLNYASGYGIIHSSTLESGVFTHGKKVRFFFQMAGGYFF